MMLTWMDFGSAVLAALVAAAYVCRLDMMNFRSARVTAIAMHLGGFGVALWVAAWSAYGTPPGPPGWFGLALSAGWIAMTWPQWRSGMPAWAKRAQNGDAA